MIIVYAFCGDRKQFEKQVRNGSWQPPRVCPACSGRMVKHGGYVRKTVVTWMPRMRCKDCGKAHTVMPHFLAPKKRVSTDEREQIITQWALGQATGA